VQELDLAMTMQGPCCNRSVTVLSPYDCNRTVTMNFAGKCTPYAGQAEEDKCHKSRPVSILS